MKYTKNPDLTEKDLHKLPHLLIQTGARYTRHGQRLLALQLDDDVLMRDYDRGIDYFFEDCPLDEYVLKQKELKEVSKSFYHPNIILWRVWDHFAKELKIDLTH